MIVTIEIKEWHQLDTLMLKTISVSTNNFNDVSIETVKLHTSLYCVFQNRIAKKCARAVLPRNAQLRATAQSERTDTPASTQNGS